MKENLNMNFIKNVFTSAERVSMAEMLNGDPKFGDLKMATLKWRPYINGDPKMATLYKWRPFNFFPTTVCLIINETNFEIKIGHFGWS